MIDKYSDIGCKELSYPFHTDLTPSFVPYTALVAKQHPTHTHTRDDGWTGTVSTATNKHWVEIKGIYLLDFPDGLVVLNHREGRLLEGVQSFPNGLLVVIHTPTSLSPFHQPPHHHLLTAFKH